MSDAGNAVHEISTMRKPKTLPKLTLSRQWIEKNLFPALMTPDTCRSNFVFPIRLDSRLLRLEHDRQMANIMANADELA